MAIYGGSFRGRGFGRTAYSKCKNGLLVNRSQNTSLEYTGSERIGRRRMGKRETEKTTVDWKVVA